MSKNYLRSTYFAIFLIVAIIEFIWYVDRSNRDFAAFLLALLQNDFTTTFSETSKGQSFNELHSAFNQITQKFKTISSEKEVQHIYLESLVEHVSVGILSYDEKEKIHLMNGALKNLLNKPQVLYLKGLEGIDKRLLNTIRHIKPGENRLVKIKLSNQLLQLSLHASEFKLHAQYYKLVSFQNIKNELDANEMDAWQKLIRVLTHEIMNSVTPISSLSNTLYEIIEKENKKGTLNQDTIQKVLTGLDAVKSRSAGLQSFTEAYRNLTRIPPPNFKEVYIKDVLKRIETLLRPNLENVDFRIAYDDESIKILADTDLLDQVIINILKNALEALEDSDNPKILITVNSQEKTKISITDNGPGIDEDKVDQVFVPFFTTKRGGSGIGLALSKQIVRLHNGTLQVESVPGQGTSFIIEL
ncbi:HAMP domain-containing histidine kinase [Fulvivirga sp. 29W222]|uniref:histidine kinase n=1 Tax=Fulvivirga marina TaxID=2494733 RepID=A0A937KAQ9_9BACT|nr:HAMP domain-containing histidine kinase [Fulvivirga marina]